MELKRLPRIWFLFRIVCIFQYTSSSNYFLLHLVCVQLNIFLHYSCIQNGILYFSFWISVKAKLGADFHAESVICIMLLVMFFFLNPWNNLTRHWVYLWFATQFDIRMCNNCLTVQSMHVLTEFRRFMINYLERTIVLFSAPVVPTLLPGFKSRVS